MATRVLLLSRPCIGADLVAAQLRARFYDVERMEPEGQPEKAPDALLIYGGGQWAATLAALGREHGLVQTPTVLLVADASLQGSALLGHWGIDACLCLPVFEDELDQTLRQLLEESARLRGLIQQWPPQLPVPARPDFDPKNWPTIIIDDDGHTSARCQLSLETRGIRARRLTWDAFAHMPPDGARLILANAGMGSRAQGNLALVRAFMDVQDTDAYFIALKDHEVDRLHHDRLMAAGARHVVSKPISQAYLIDLIERIAVFADYERQLRDDLRELRDKTSRDELTGLMNRQAASRLLNYTPAMSLAVLDLNNLKTINDRLGHLAGDAAIRAVGQALLTAFAGQNLVLVRWGGDEFMVYSSQGRDMTPSLHAAQEALSKIELDAHGRRSQSPSFSYGIACGHEGGDFAAIMALADQRLYRDKAQKKGPKRNPFSKNTYGIAT